MAAVAARGRSCTSREMPMILANRSKANPSLTAEMTKRMEVRQKNLAADIFHQLETFLTFCSDHNMFGPAQKQPDVPGVDTHHPSGGVLAQNSKISANKN